MDATTLATALGTLLVGLGGLVGGVVAYLGKRGETALTGYTALAGDLKEERDRLQIQVTALLAERATDQAEITRLRIENARLEGPRRDPH